MEQDNIREETEGSEGMSLSWSGRRTSGRRATPTVEEGRACRLWTGGVEERLYMGQGRAGSEH